MRSRRRLLTSIILVPSLGSFLYLVRQQEPTAAREPFGVWSPTPAAIQQELGPPLALPFDAPMQRQRRKRFAQRFKDRYRNHADHYAVCLSFASDHRLILQTPARMEPWNVDKIALSAWQESRANFGHSFDIDVYETYICAPPRKIGAVRAVPGSPDRAQARYDYPVEPITP